MLFLKHARQSVSFQGASTYILVPFVVVLLLASISQTVTWQANAGRGHIFHEAFRKGEDAYLNEAIIAPEFDLAKINAFCGTNIPMSAFTSCKNKRFAPIGEDGHVRKLGEQELGHSGYSPMVFPTLFMLGERHSGTNLAATLLTDNFDLILNSTIIKANTEYHMSLTDFGPNQHKHEMQKDEGFFNGLSVISVRNPYDYVKAMNVWCFGCNPRGMSRLDPLAFVNAKFEGFEHEVGYSFKDIFDMRQRKLCNHIRVAAERTDCVVIVRQEDNLLKHQQERYIWRIARLTGWPLRGGIPDAHAGYSGHMRWRRKTDFTPIGYLNESIFFATSYVEKDERIIEAVNSKIDVDFEAMLGYSKITLASSESVSVSPSESVAIESAPDST